VHRFPMATITDERPVALSKAPEADTCIVRDAEGRLSLIRKQAISQMVSVAGCNGSIYLEWTDSISNSVSEIGMQVSESF